MCPILFPQARLIARVTFGLLAMLSIGACGDPGSIDLFGPGGATGSGGGSGSGGSGGSGHACSADAQCSSPRPYCDVAANQCVECLGDKNCGDRTCDLVTHECVECVGPANCPQAGTTCDPLSRQCVASCSTNTDCTSSDQPTCDTARGVCVQCLADTSCGGELPYCDTARGVCVQCLGNANCASGHTCVDHECSG